MAVIVGQTDCRARLEDINGLGGLWVGLETGLAEAVATARVEYQGNPQDNLYQEEQHEDHEEKGPICGQRPALRDGNRLQDYAHQETGERKGRESDPLGYGRRLISQGSLQARMMGGNVECYMIGRVRLKVARERVHEAQIDVWMDMVKLCDKRVLQPIDKDL